MAMVLGQEWDSQALLCLLGTDGTVDDFGSVPDFQLWSRKLKNTTHWSSIIYFLLLLLYTYTRTSGRVIGNIFLAERSGKAQQQGNCPVGEYKSLLSRLNISHAITKMSQSRKFFLKLS